MARFDPPSTHGSTGSICIAQVAVSRLTLRLQSHVAESGRLRPSGAACAKEGQHTDRLQNPAKLRRFRIGGGIGGRIIRDFRKMLHFGKIPEKFGQIWRKFSKILSKFANFWKKKQQQFPQILTKILRLESGAKEFLLFSGLFWPGPFFPIFRLWIPKRCKGVHCVDLGESFLTSIYLQKFASIQPRTSSFNFD